MSLKIDQQQLDQIRQTMLEKISREILSVQPMPSLNFHELAKEPLWQSFVDRHIRNHDRTE